MADERTIVYGLGRMFVDNYAQIHEKYNIVGYCDADSTSRNRFVNSFAPEELAAKALEYDVLLITPRHGGSIARELVVKYGVDINKVRMLCLPSLMSPSKKVSSIIPDLVMHGIYQEDMAVLYLCRKLELDCNNIYYGEVGLFHIINGSATYCLYRKGARGLLLLEPYDDWEKQAKVYRPDDKILSLRTVKASGLLECKEKLDVLSLHKGCSTAEWLDVVYMKKPKILIVMAKDIDMIEKIIAHGYIWFTSLQGVCAVFYRF